MKKVRKNVFETNSSSTHTLSIVKPMGKDYLPFGKNLKIRWIDTDDEYTLISLTDKVSYLVSHIASWYKHNAVDYDDLIEQVKNNYDFKCIEKYVKENYGKEIVFPKYSGDIENVTEINHQLTSWNNSLDEVLEDIVDKKIDYLAEVLQDGKSIDFGRD